MPDKYQIIPTTDGSHTIYLPHLDETYHSRHGAIAESLHVFIEQGFNRLSHLQSLTILEIGFGTGLNCLLTMLAQKESRQNITYYSIEPYPLGEAVTAHLNYTANMGEEAGQLFKAMHAAAWNQPAEMQPRFTLVKLHGTLDTANTEHAADLVYFDAFAPSKQPELWNMEALEKVSSMMNAGGILCTYCAQGQFKRNLKALGFDIENPPGANGKRQMTVAILNKIQ